jgi:hypothetical protein
LYDRESWWAQQLVRTGEVRRKVPPTRTAQALDQLTSSGWTLGRVAEKAQVSYPTLSRARRLARNGDRGWVWSTVEQRVLGLLDGDAG